MNQIGSECRQTVVLALRPAIFDHHIAAFDEAGFAQATAKCVHELPEGTLLRAIEEPDHRHYWLLLRARRERPRGSRAAEQRDELAPAAHSITSSAISRRRARERSAARLSRARGGDFSVCAMLLLIAAIGTTWMACDEGRQA